MDSHDIQRLGDVIRTAIFDGLNDARVQTRIDAATNGEDPARAARIARVDATAREYAVGRACTGDTCGWCYYEASIGEPSKLVVVPEFFKGAYDFALALERARDEAVKEIE